MEGIQSVTALLKDDPVVASARTYLRCARVIADAFGVDVQVKHQYPRGTFEATVLACRGRAEASEGTLTCDDFSKNQILEVMEETLVGWLGELRADTGKRHGACEVTRREFIYRVHDNLIQHYGLQAQRLKVGETGNYAMINSLMQTFLRRAEQSILSRGLASPKQKLRLEW